MYNLRDEKGPLKAKIPDDVAWSIIHKRIVEYFTGPRNLVCLRVTLFARRKPRHSCRG